MVDGLTWPAPGARIQTVALQPAATVKIVAIGTKEGNRLFVHGEEYEL